MAATVYYAPLRSGDYYSTSSVPCHICEIKDDVVAHQSIIEPWASPEASAVHHICKTCLIGRVRDLRGTRELVVCPFPGCSYEIKTIENVAINAFFPKVELAPPLLVLEGERPVMMSELIVQEGAVTEYEGQESLLLRIVKGF